ncbi:hypothetical protein YN1HA_18460 [Sulfurisphaera ohwakuensis]
MIVIEIKRAFLADNKAAYHQSYSRLHKSFTCAKIGLVK